RRTSLVMKELSSISWAHHEIRSHYKCAEGQTRHSPHQQVARMSEAKSGISCPHGEVSAQSSSGRNLSLHCDARDAPDIASLIRATLLRCYAAKNKAFRVSADPISSIHPPYKFLIPTISPRQHAAEYK